MSHCSAGAFAALVLVISLLFTASPEPVNAGDLNGAPPATAASLAIGNECDGSEAQRLTRQFYSSIAESGVSSSAFSPAFSWFHGNAYSPARPRKLFRLNVVFLI